MCGCVGHFDSTFLFPVAVTHFCPSSNKNGYVHVDVNKKHVFIPHVCPQSLMDGTNRTKGWVDDTLPAVTFENGRFAILTINDGKGRFLKTVFLRKHTMKFVT